MSAKGVVFAILMLLSGPAFAQEKPVDPTRNVLDKVMDAVKRLDDLRESADRLADERNRNIKEILALRDANDDKLKKAETGRVDALRLFDNNNVTSALATANATATALAKKGDDAAQVLSANVIKSADDIRTTVKNTADDQARNLATLLGGIQTQITDSTKRLTALEQAGAEGLGKTKFQDPAQAQIIAALTATVNKLNEKSDTSTGAGIGRGEVIAYAIAGIMLLLAILQYMSRVSVPPSSITPSYNQRRSKPKGP